MNRFRFAPLALVFTITLLFATGASAQSTDRAKLAKEIESLRAELQLKEQRFLAPFEEDHAAFAEFLRQPGTGLCRLLPREKFDGKLMMRGGGSYYSFTRLTSEYGFGSDVGLEQNYFLVGFAGANWGYITKLGDVPLESVGLDHLAVQFLATLETPSHEPGAREQQRLSGTGVMINSSTYASRVPALVNTTYVLRSIDYSTSDVLVVFRVVRQDSDGSLTLLWKNLKEFPKPELKR
ncbi:MAG: hypothetical protein ACJ74J_02230 [Blastocatellia bacterium]